MQTAPTASAEEIIGATVIQAFPGLPPAPAANCIARNATLEDRSALAAQRAGPASAKTIEIVRSIAARSVTQTCFAEQGVTPVSLG